MSENRKILAIDYGRKRIGLAIADSATSPASPLATLDRINRNEDMRRLRELVSQYGVKQLVVGLPLRLDGTRGEMAEEAERFANRARKQICVSVEMIDERLTSWEAERLLEDEFGKRSQVTAGPKAQKAKNQIGVDAVAAAVILREYLQKIASARKVRAAAKESR